jgi:hypothetical protein
MLQDNATKGVEAAACIQDGLAVSTDNHVKAQVQFVV